MKRVLGAVVGLAVGASALGGVATAQEPAEPTTPAATILITTANGREVRSLGGSPADGSGGTVNLGDITIGPGTTVISPVPPSALPEIAPPPAEEAAPTIPEIAPPPPAPAASLPGDGDADNLPDDAEADQGTNPADQDSDDDFLADGDELNIYRTRPLVFDTDGDGRGDGEEIFGAAPSNPLVSDAAGAATTPTAAPAAPAPPPAAPTSTAAPAPAPRPAPTATPAAAPQPAATAPPAAAPVVDDRDGDNLPDAAEATYNTSPDDADSDGDGLADGDETGLYGTAPLTFDTDGDGRGDGNELFVTDSDPLVRDEAAAPTPAPANS